MRGKKLLALIGSICLILVLAALPFMGACAKPAPPAEAKILKIGALSALTGFASPAEVHQRDGVLMAVDWINENGGITVNGEKYLLQAVVEDNQTTTEGTVSAAEKLIYDHGINFICGSTVPYVNLAAATVTEPAKVIRALNYVCTPAELGPDMPYTFLANPAIEQGAGPALDWLAENYPEAKTIGMITPEDGAEGYLIPFCAAAAEERGLSQISAVAWPHDTVDFYPLVTQLLAPKPDAMFVVNGYEAATAPIIRAAREQGFTGPIPMGNYDCPYDIINMAGADNVYDFCTHGWSKDTTLPDMPPVMKEVITTANAQLSGGFHQWNLWGWNEVYTICQAIEYAQSLDPTEVAEAWREMTSIDTVYGPGKMGGLETYGINNVVVCPLALTLCENGEVIHLEWVLADIP